MKYNLQILVIVIGLVGHAFSQNDNSRCSRIQLSGPQGITNPGETATFVLNAAGQNDLDGLRFQWQTSLGKIVSGQGTPRIEVLTSREDSGSNVKVSVTISDRDRGCSAYLSDASPIANRLPNEVLDEFGKLPDNDIRGRLDTFFSELTNRSGYEGVLQIYFGNESRQFKISKIKLIYNHIILRKFDPTRISFYVSPEKYDSFHTRVWTTPPGFDFSEIGIDESSIIRAETLKTDYKKIISKIN